MAEPNFTNYRTEQPAEVVAENLDRVSAEGIYFDKVRPRLIASEEQASGIEIYPSRKAKLERLYEYGRNNGINADDKFAQAEGKRRALTEIMGYKALRGSRSVADASDAMIGEVYQKDFYAGRELRH